MCVSNAHLQHVGISDIHTLLHTPPNSWDLFDTFMSFLGWIYYMFLYISCLSSLMYSPSLFSIYPLCYIILVSLFCITSLSYGIISEHSDSYIKSETSALSQHLPAY
jgi:uncharacterized membrane protein